MIFWSGAGLVVWVVFLIRYTLRARWWETRLGTNMFGVSAIVVALLLRDTLFLPLEYRLDVQWEGVLVYPLAIWLGADRLVQLERIQNEYEHSD